jgi:hypothetical protein
LSRDVRRWGKEGVSLTDGEILSGLGFRRETRGSIAIYGSTTVSFSSGKWGGVRNV